MLKVMIFIDGSWLSRTRHYLNSRVADTKLRIHYGKLPHVLVDLLSKQMNVPSVYLVRTYFFASLPISVDPRDTQDLEKQRGFYDKLKRDFHYEVELFAIDFKGRRYYPRDRDPNDRFAPREKRVDVALSVSLVSLAMQCAYNIAVTVVGDADYIPALQRVRQLGKRVMIATVHENCPDVYDPIEDPIDSQRVRDYDTVFLDEILPEILRGGPYKITKCESEFHQGNRWIWASEQKVNGGPYYCPKCRNAFKRWRLNEEVEQLTSTEEPVKEAISV